MIDRASQLLIVELGCVTRYVRLIVYYIGRHIKNGCLYVFVGEGVSYRVKYHLGLGCDIYGVYFGNNNHIIYTQKTLNST